MINHWYRQLGGITFLIEGGMFRCSMSEIKNTSFNNMSIKTRKQSTLKPLKSQLKSFRTNE